MRSSSWLIACSAASARSSDVIAIVSLRKSNVAPMIGCRASDCQAPPCARTAQAHRLSSPSPFRVIVGARRAQDLLYHLICLEEHRLRDRQPERSRGLEVDHQLELGRLLDREVAGLGALEDL